MFKTQTLTSNQISFHFSQTQLHSQQLFSDGDFADFNSESLSLNENWEESWIEIWNFRSLWKNQTKEGRILKFCLLFHFFKRKLKKKVGAISSLYLHLINLSHSWEPRLGFFNLRSNDIFIAENSHRRPQPQSKTISPVRYFLLLFIISYFLDDLNSILGLILKTQIQIWGNAIALRVHSIGEKPRY